MKARGCGGSIKPIPFRDGRDSQTCRQSRRHARLRYMDSPTSTAGGDSMVGGGCARISLKDRCLQGSCRQVVQEPPSYCRVHGKSRLGRGYKTGLWSAVLVEPRIPPASRHAVAGRGSVNWSTWRQGVPPSSGNTPGTTNRAAAAFYG